MASGASAAMETESVKRPEPVELKPRAAAAPERRRPSILVPLLLSVMVVAGVAGVIVWQAGLMPGVVSSASAENKSPASAAPADAAPVVSPEPQPLPASQPQTDATDTATDPAGRKPSPLGGSSDVSPPSEPAVAAPVRPSIAARLQDVWVSTNPPGAKAVLDNDLSQSCLTPCMIHAPSGLHHLTFSQAGYENEYREVHIGETAQDLPPVTLRQPSGTLMLSTNPPGASVRVNGKLIPQITPAEITLAPGSYMITVEKSGKSQTQRVDIEQNPVYLRIPL